MMTVAHTESLSKSDYVAGSLKILLGCFQQISLNLIINNFPALN